MTWFKYLFTWRLDQGWWLDLIRIFRACVPCNSIYTHCIGWQLLSLFTLFTILYKVAMHLLVSSPLIWVISQQIEGYSADWSSFGQACLLLSPCFLFDWSQVYCLIKGLLGLGKWAWTHFLGYIIREDVNS